MLPDFRWQWAGHRATLADGEAIGNDPALCKILQSASTCFETLQIALLQNASECCEIFYFVAFTPVHLP
jgi:hypothetical protein